MKRTAMLHAGVTGGIGSGKTTVCALFEALGIPVYYADDRAKWLMEHDETLVGKIKELFGAHAYTETGALNRSWIADQVFGQPDLLQQLNQIVHPAVAEDGLKWQNEQVDAPYTLKEAALLYESGSFAFLDKIIVVTAPLELRIQRVLQRDGLSREAVLERIARQMPEEEKVARADYVITNDGTRSVIEQVLAVHRLLIAL